MNKLEGRMVIMLNQLIFNKTPFELTCTGLELGPTRTQILAKHIKNNTSLLSLHMSRKGVTDMDGYLLAHMLWYNKKLRKLELEGNQLGPQSLVAFGKALMNNDTLQYLDLESN